MSGGDPDAGDVLVGGLGPAETERSRLAELLHDGPLSGLIAARQDLDELGDPRVAGVVAQLDATIRDLRELTRAHDAERLAELPLGAAIEVLVRSVVRPGRTRVELDLRDVEELGPHAALVRTTVLELATNAVRHADARLLIVSTGRAESTGMALSVANDGLPLDRGRLAEGVRSGHFGVGRLFRRVRLAGGRLSFTHDDGLTTVTVTLPRGSGPTWAEAADPGLDPWVIVRADGVYTHVSEAMSRLVGYSRTELLLTPVAERPWFADPDRAQSRRAAIVAATVERGVHATETALRHRDGRVLPALATSHLLQTADEDGTPRFLALFRPLRGHGARGDAGRAAP